MRNAAHPSAVPLCTAGCTMGGGTEIEPRGRRLSALTQSADIRFEWLLSQVANVFPQVPNSNLRTFASSDEALKLVGEFLDGQDEVTCLYLTAVPDKGKGLGQQSLKVHTEAPGNTSKGKCCYMIKLDKQAVSTDDYQQQVMVGDVPAMNVLEHMTHITRNIYMPLLRAYAEEQGWGEVMHKKIMESFNTFTANAQITWGQAQGVTCLPLPDNPTLYEDPKAKLAKTQPVESVSPGNKEEMARAAKEGMHTLEGTIITWTKQIKNVLKQDPEQLIMNPDKHYGPLQELQFWKQKAANLNAIFRQLQSDGVRKILRHLDRNKSTYSTPFAKICKEVFAAREEANNNVKHLAPLETWLDKLDSETDFAELAQLFRPILHIILLVWKTSGYYNTATRLVVLLRLLCNTLIKQTTVCLKDGVVFQLIEAEQPKQAIDMLKGAITTIGHFKTAFFEYKAKANKECQDKPWRIQNNAIFVRLDSFLDRCHDVLNMTQAITQFQKLAKLEIGGTKGKVLSTSINQVYLDFVNAVADVRDIDYDIMDLDADDFEDSYYHFRMRVKNFEQRLASILVQGFDDCPTIAGRFRLLDCFADLVHRPSIADELEKKHLALINDFYEDLGLVLQLFQQGKDDPPVSHNLPPIAGALTWSRGLLERVSLPMQKLQRIDKKILEREEAREVLKTYTSLVGQLADFENSRIEEWGRSIQETSEEKLKNPLLRRGEDRMLSVNFDPLLIRLLREIKYFLLLDLNVPESALEIYNHGEIFRRHMGNLDLIVQMYNTVQSTLLPVEKPLLQAQLQKIDKQLLQGIGGAEADAAGGGSSSASKKKSKSMPKTGQQSLNWRSTGIDAFVGEASTEMREVSETLGVMKANLKVVEEQLTAWRLHPLFDRGTKTTSIELFEQMQRIVVTQRCAAVRENGHEIHKLLKDTNRKLKVSQGLPDWKSYVDFVNTLVVEGLTQVVVASLQALNQQMDHGFITKSQLSPMLEIELHLVDGQVQYHPEVGAVATYADMSTVASGAASQPQRTLRDMVRHWVDGFLGVCKVFRRLDAPDGTYLKEIQEDPAVRMLLARLHQRLDALEKQTTEFKSQFTTYKYLWETDIQGMFAEFLNDAEYEEELEDEDDDGGDKENDKSKPRTTVKMMDLEEFDEKIRFYLEVQDDVSQLKHQHDLEIIRINAQPIKQAISTWVTKWIFVFTQKLQDHVCESLDRVQNFMVDTQEGLSTEVDAADKDGIMKVMTHIRDVRKRAPEIAALFGPLKETVLLLKSRGIPMDAVSINGQTPMDYLESGPLLWDNTVNKAYRVKGEIQPLQNAAADSTRKDITKFSCQVKEFAEFFRANAPFNWQKPASTDASAAHKQSRASYRQLDKLEKQLGQLDDKAAALRELEELFELAHVRHHILTEIRAEMRLLKMVWDMVFIVESLFSCWTHTLWEEIQTDSLLEEVRSLQSQIRKLPRRVRDWHVYQDVESRVGNMAIVLPVVHELHSPAMRDRHWKALLDVAGHAPSSAEKTESKSTLDTILSPTFCLDDVLSLNLHDHVDAAMEVIEVASKELKVETRLESIEAHWSASELEFGRHRDTEVHILSSPDEILEALEDHQMQLQSMAGMGRFVDFFRKQVIQWQDSLGEVESCLKLLLGVQKQWGSLEAIFLMSKDIRAQLPDDTKRFEGIDSDFKDVMKEIAACPNAVKSCTAEGRDQMLCQMHKELEKCERALNEYLDLKKNVFPRFYFVSNAALLDILSNGNSPPKIQPHLGSVFDGIGELELLYPEQSQVEIGEHEEGSEGGERGERKPEAHIDTALAMLAKDSEKIPFHEPFKMEGAVESWLTKLVTWMQVTLKTTLDAGLKEAVLWDVEKPREDWLFGYPAQLALLACQIIWTEEAEASLEEYENGAEDAVKKYLEVCTARLEGLIRLVQGQLTVDERTKVITMITIDVHSRDVIGTLIEKRVESSLDFTWQSQLRYYWAVDGPAAGGGARGGAGGDDASRGAGNRPAAPAAGGSKAAARIKICDFRSSYSFEYVGNCGRLVITPLTDRCYVTLTTALRLMLGGAPAGPAGTGKTETTKDLARGMGLACYVFNCSDQMNFRTMGDIFKGLVQVGAWGCFDEFNRISIEVLSVVASQVKAIQDGIVRLANPELREPMYQSLPSGTPNCLVGKFDFMGEAVGLVPTCGLFITMNPGYAGRTELPENLKALFRSCAMIRPDLKPICENMLMSEGFVKARPLAVKFVTLYQLSSELLSKQFHYDWGLRAVKSVLLVAGKLKRADPEIDEEAVLMRALRDFNTPKIVSADSPIFLRLIADLFPGMDLPPKVNEALKQLCANVCTETLSLQPDPEFILKVVQFQELLEVRHSVMVLGPAGCGKTTVWKALAACHNHGHAKPCTVTEAVNPKAVTSDELYGYMTLAKDWKDGVMSIIMRNMSKEWAPFTSHHTSKWVVLDGDIDAVWIESMNTVMDDNKVLTLVSNERIPLTPSMRMIFEIHSLKNATPATVSRAGILYINENDIGWQPFVESWLQVLTTETETAVLPGLFSKYIPQLIDLLKRKGLEPLVPMPTIAMVRTVCLLLEGMLPRVQADGNRSVDCLERLFLFAAMWAFGGGLSSEDLLDSRQVFSNEWRSTVVSKALKFPDKGLVFDYFIKPETTEVQPWADLVQPFEGSPGQSFASIVVPTVDLTRITYLMDMLIAGERHVMLVGSAGTGKTMMVNNFMKGLNDHTLTATINMNYYTDAAALQLQLEQHIDKRSGKTYGPPTGSKLVYFIDDLNMPLVETYGTQTPIALLRQHVDYKGWYDRQDLGLRKVVQGVQFIASMNHKRGSLSINPRLQRHFVTLACQMPNSPDLDTIYGAILENHLTDFSNSVKRIGKILVEATRAIHQGMTTKFLPTAVNFHYNFNLRDLSAVFQGLCLSTPDMYETSLSMARLWAHECSRVFSDRLVTMHEMKLFQDLLKDVAKKYLDEDNDKLFKEPNIFTSFAVETEDEVPTYLPVPTLEVLKKALETKVVEYNESHAIMNMVLFEQAMLHITRIARILRFPCGSALLVGVGGSGKQTLAKLASFLSECEVYQIVVTSSYGIPELKNDLKDMYKKAAVKPAEPLVFLLTESQIVDEHFLVYINDLLSSGLVPDLFAKDEYDAIFQALRPAAKMAGVPDSRDELMEFFVNRVRANLHVVLAFSPVGDAFRTRARKFPALVNCTSMDWFHAWPRDALVSVAQAFLEDIEIGSVEVQENIAHHMAEVHHSVEGASKRFLELERRYNYTTPKSFLELIAFFKSLLGLKQAQLASSIKRLDTGLKTLQKTNNDVQSLRDVLKAKMVEVESKKASTEQLLLEMGQQRSEAEVQQKIADHEKEKADAAAQEALKIETEADKDLAEARPAMEAAKSAVDCLDKASMTELKSFSKPPPGVDKVTMAVLIMVKGEKKNFSWENAKKMMAKVDAFKEQLEQYRGEDIPEDVVKRVEPLLADPNFTFDKMKSKSAAAANLCNWVVNIVNFNRLYKKVKPLMDALEKARKAKDAAMMDLHKVEMALEKINHHLDELQRSFMAATEEKSRVEKEAHNCEDRLSLAERLTRGLASENERWGMEIENLQSTGASMVGDVLLSAAFVSYVGSFSRDLRDSLWSGTWLPDLIGREIPVRDGLHPLDLLSNASQVAEWQNEGLPADQLSEKDWMKTVINAIQTGGVVIIESCGETIDAALNPVLQRSVQRKGKHYVLKIGGEDVDYDPNFRLYLQTKLSNPHYPPEIFATCTLINFIVTAQGLEDQLLAKVVGVEQPEMERTKNELVQASNRYKIQLQELEDQLLERLANAPDDILSDVNLIDGLEAMKDTAKEINVAARRGKETEVGINEAREVYRPVAAEASMLYFMLLRLCLVDSMYQYSLDSFTKFFFKAIRLSEKNADHLVRVGNLQRGLRYTIYEWVCRGLFEHHRLIFLTQITLGLMQTGTIGSESGFSTAGLKYLLRGPKKVTEESPLSWLSAQSWGAVRSLSELDGFEKFADDLQGNAPRFQEWFKHVTPESEKLPLDWRELDKTPFLKLLVVRVLRPDRITQAVTSFIRMVLPDGAMYTDLDEKLNSFQVLEEAFKDSGPDTPMYFILSPGANITADIDRMAKAREMERGKTYHNISLGQGQDIVAVERLDVGHAQGHWVVLNNVHLMPRWLPVLEKRLDEYEKEQSHSNFRIMLSSDPSNQVPIGLLERSIKLTNDPPSGLKANLKQAFASIAREQYEEFEPRTRGILFGLCYFHALVLERKKFGPKGFNMAYPFSRSDLTCSTAVLNNYMESAPSKVPWADLRYLFGEIMYGGHVVNDFDRLMCKRYLEFFLKDELLDEMPLYPYPDTTEVDHDNFQAPSVTYGYEQVVDHIEGTLQGNSPLAFGLHPNAEIGFRTETSENLLSTVLELSPEMAVAGAGDASGGINGVELVAQEVLEAFKETRFDIDVIANACEGEMGPYQNVLVQECQRMNILVEEIVHTLTDLCSAFKGDLTMTEQLEVIEASIAADRVPSQWEVMAFPSTRALPSWLTNVQARGTQLSDWSSNPLEIPLVTWISGLFNPSSFLTAIMQVSAQAQGMELDRLSIVTDITKKADADEITAASRDGAYICGLGLDGARWNMQGGHLESSKPREMYFPMPVINCAAAVIDKVDPSVYMCPVYKTQQRGPTYVFSANLKSAQGQKRPACHVLTMQLL